MNTTVKTVKRRDSNLELFRIVTMLLIIAHHYVVNSGLYHEVLPEEPISGKTVFYYLFGAWGKTGINCFVLITGYFMCTSSISLRKYSKLLLEVLFYNIVLTCVFALARPEEFSVVRFVYNIMPVKSVAQGFVGAFLLFYLFIPFLNILIRQLDRIKHLLLIALCLFTYTVIGTMPLPVSMNYVSWFCVIYLIGSYLRFYPPPPSVFVADRVPLLAGRKITAARFWGAATAVSLLLSMVSIVVCMYISAYMNRNLQYWFVSDSNKMLALLTSVTAFMFFKHLNIGYSRTINIMGASTFGVLLIHANSDAMRRWLWQDTLHNVAWFDNGLYWLHAIVSVMAIFIVCTAIDRVRIRFIETPLFKMLDSRMARTKYNGIWFNATK